MISKSINSQVKVFSVAESKTKDGETVQNLDSLINDLVENLPNLGLKTKDIKFSEDLTKAVVVAEPISTCTDYKQRYDVVHRLGKVFLNKFEVESFLKSYPNALRITERPAIYRHRNGGLFRIVAQEQIGNTDCYIYYYMPINSTHLYARTKASWDDQVTKHGEYINRFTELTEEELIENDLYNIEDIMELKSFDEII